MLTSIIDRLQNVLYLNLRLIALSKITEHFTYFT